MYILYMAALFIATMAFLLALFVYFKNCSTRNLLEPLVPGFEEKMKSNWVVTGRGGAEDDIVMAFRGDIKFEFKQIIIPVNKPILNTRDFKFEFSARFTILPYMRIIKNRDIMILHRLFKSSIGKDKTMSIITGI